MATNIHSGQNIEIKLRLVDRDEAVRVCRQLCATFSESLTQIDTYYETANRRLKQREELGKAPVLIVYDRPNAQRPAPSDYTLYAMDSIPEELLADMQQSIGVVHKHRDLWMRENVRIHLDSVTDLGEFLEFEAIVDDARDAEASRAAVEFLTDAFSKATGGVVGRSNLDLLLDAQSQHDQTSV